MDLVRSNRPLAPSWIIDLTSPTRWFGFHVGLDSILPAIHNYFIDTDFVIEKKLHRLPVYALGLSHEKQKHRNDREW